MKFVLFLKSFLIAAVLLMQLLSCNGTGDIGTSSPPEPGSGSVTDPDSPPPPPCAVDLSTVSSVTLTFPDGVPYKSASTPYKPDLYTEDQYKSMSLTIESARMNISGGGEFQGLYLQEGVYRYQFFDLQSTNNGCQQSVVFFEQTADPSLQLNEVSEMAFSFLFVGDTEVRLAAFPLIRKLDTGETLLSRQVGNVKIEVAGTYQAVKQ